MASAETANHEYVLLTWGANSYGQLGLGHSNDVTSPSMANLVLEKPVQLAGGGGHSVILEEDGKVRSCGWNKHFQTGIAIQNDEIKALIEVPYPTPVAKVSCGWNHSITIDIHGFVYVSGSNSYGQLGLSYVKDRVTTPSLISSKLLGNRAVVDVCCGLRHSAAVTDEGTLFTWGSGKRGQLGHGKGGVSHSNTPLPVEALSGVFCAKVSAGAYNTLTCSVDGTVFACGCNTYGQCTVGLVGDMSSEEEMQIDEKGVVKAVRVPSKVKHLPPVADIHCGWSHVITITRVDRRVFVWGRCDYGQLGLPLLEQDKQSFIPVPTEVEALKGIKQVACGSEHSIAIDGDDQLLTWGWNEHGMCGTGDEKNVKIPRRITVAPPSSRPHLSDPTPLLVGAGAGHTMTVLQIPNRT